MLKTCNLCGSDKELSNYHKDKSKRDGHSNWCKSCKKEKDALKRDVRRDQHLARRYNISTEVYDHMYSKQNGCCNICRKNFTQLCVDHCHKTGNVRGLLCQTCNKGLGLLMDDVSYLTNAIAYLNEHAGAERTAVPADSSVS